jgi:N-acetylmuramoyl-L-alanine amidase
MGILLCINAPIFAATVTNWRWLQSADQMPQLSIDLNERTTFRLFSLSNPSRIVVDLLNTNTNLSPISPPNTLWIKQMRVGDHQNHFRIVLDMARPATPQAFWLTTQNQPRLVITLNNATPIVESKPVDLPQKKPETVPPPPISKFTPKGREFVIAIDAGHGGMDSGTVGVKGAHEKNIALAIAQELKYLINKNNALKAVMTREKDEFLRLRERLDRARQAQADVFVSIHADSNRESNQVHGASVYMLSPKGASSEAAKWLAEKENSADLIGGVSLSDKDDVLASILLDLSQTGTLELSSKLAQQVLSSLSGTTTLVHQDVQQAAFLVLKSPDVPSILIETGFLSNRSDEQKLNDPNYRRQLAVAIFKGIQNYLSQHALVKP